MRSVYDVRRFHRELAGLLERVEATGIETGSVAYGKRPEGWVQELVDALVAVGVKHFVRGGPAAEGRGRALTRVFQHRVVDRRVASAKKPFWWAKLRLSREQAPQPGGHFGDERYTGVAAGEGDR